MVGEDSLRGNDDKISVSHFSSRSVSTSRRWCFGDHLANPSPVSNTEADFVIIQRSFSAASHQLASARIGSTRIVTRIDSTRLESSRSLNESLWVQQRPFCESPPSLGGSISLSLFCGDDDGSTDTLRCRFRIRIVKRSKSDEITPSWIGLSFSSRLRSTGTLDPSRYFQLCSDPLRVDHAILRCSNSEISTVGSYWEVSGVTKSAV